MGHGIAYVCATAGVETVLYDVDLGAVDDGLKPIRSELEKAVSLGKVTEPEREEALGRIQRSSDLAFAVQGAELIIEAAPKSLDIKRGLFRLLDQRVGEDTVFATNTSALSISQLATGWNIQPVSSVSTSSGRSTRMNWWRSFGESRHLR